MKPKLFNPSFLHCALLVGALLSASQLANAAAITVNSEHLLASYRRYLSKPGLIDD